jgi:hypothetical protein
VKLKVLKGQAQQPVNGVQATVIRNDINGATLVIEGGTEILNIHISDLIDLVREQEKAEGEKSEQKTN